MERKIIIGYEHTSQGLDALDLGGVFAETLAATPVVATAVPWPDYLMGPTDLEHALAHETADLFALAEDRLAPLECETRAVANRSPGEALYTLAEDERAMLIVVGSTHRGMIGRVLPGSVGSALLHGAPCAVAVAPRDYAARSQERLQNIGVAFDGSPEAWTALQTAVALTERLHGRLTVLTVADLRPGYETSLSIFTAGEYQTYEVREKRRLLESAVAQLPADLAVEPRLLEGPPDAVLDEASEDLDLLLIGSRGYGPLRRTALGSVSASVLDSAHCPVLVLPRGAGMDPLGIRPSDRAASAPAA